MTPDDLAALHARAFITPAPWSARDFAELLADPAIHLIEAAEGFLVLRIVAGEAEVLTLAVAPEARRRGIGRALVGRALALAGEAGADTVFLEVAVDNAPACALYEQAGFRPAGRRPGYYRAPDGARIDALVLRLGPDAASS